MYTVLSIVLHNSCSNQRSYFQSFAQNNILFKGYNHKIQTFFVYTPAHRSSFVYRPKLDAVITAVYNNTGALLGISYMTAIKTMTCNLIKEFLSEHASFQWYKKEKTYYMYISVCFYSLEIIHIKSTKCTRLEVV